jgi:penicillin-binding protein 1A
MNTSASSTGTTPSKAAGLLGSKKPWFRKFIRYTWIIFFCVVIGLPLYVFTVSVDLFGLFGGMPSLAEVENPENDLSSELISADGVSLGRYFRFNRSQVTFDELSEDLVNTLVLSEDHRFYEHSGLDFPAYLRVAWGLLTLQPSGGGSTITQQLAKNLYLSTEKNLVRKLKEYFLALHLERELSKNRILHLYLNVIELGPGIFGVEAAARYYFGKSVGQLNLEEIVRLTAVIPKPLSESPMRSSRWLKWKARWILSILYKTKHISADQYHQAGAGLK